MHVKLFLVSLKGKKRSVNTEVENNTSEDITFQKMATWQNTECEAFKNTICIRIPKYIFVGIRTLQLGSV